MLAKACTSMQWSQKSISISHCEWAAWLLLLALLVMRIQWQHRKDTQCNARHDVNVPITIWYRSCSLLQRQTFWAVSASLDVHQSLLRLYDKFYTLLLLGANYVRKRHISWKWWLT